MSAQKEVIGNDDTKSKQDFSFLIDSKKIDIFQHLKLNLKNEKENCKDNNRIAMYCIPCKVSICDKCKLEEHQKHILISKSQFDFNEATIDEIYNQIIKAVSSDQLFIDYKPIQNQLIEQVDKMIESLQKKLEKLKEIKTKEIIAMFNGFTSNVNNLKQRIEKARTDLKQYYQKNRKFFNLVPANSNNNSTIESKRDSPKKAVPKIYNTDESNSIFLINYELLNISQLKGKDILSSAKRITQCVDTFKDNQNEYIETLLNNVDNIFFGEYAARAEQDQELDTILDEASPSYGFQLAIDKLNDKEFSDINVRISQYNTLYDSFKRTIFDSIAKYGNLKEIENYISGFESSKKSDSESLLFSQRAKEKSSKTRKSELALLKMNYNSKDEVILNNDILEKYFSYLTLETYEKHFKQTSKELQSSHADLMIKKSDDEDEIKDFGKAIENTNLILLYYRKEQQMVKQTVQLKNNPLGYKTFPNGCRSLLIGDKLYITGGKDEQKYYPNVLIYDRKTGKIKRIMDLIEPRAYHTMVYCEVFETLMVLGGENCSSCEIFDPITNRWALLPELNSPRANVLFQFDKPRGIMYSLFGNCGNIIDGLYSNEIEYLDLKELRKGWIRLDYKNKAEADFKTYLSVVEINNDLSLIYGGYTSRNCERILCVLNKEKKEVTKCDKKMLEMIREETKYSRRLSTIVGGLSVTN